MDGVLDRPTVDVDEAAVIDVVPVPHVGQTPAQPRAVGRYVLLEVLGIGGMGVVHAAYDPKLDRKIALKILHAKGQRSETGRARLVREAQALARLSHPNIVTVHDVDVFEGKLYIAMEFVDGVPLDDWLDKHTRGWSAIVAAFVEAARGLAAAHAAGITHRDFKPGNVVVGTDERIRVLDFGLAKTVGNEELRGESDDLRASDSGVVGLSSSIDMKLTQAGRSVGTPAFMSPEQLHGLPVDHATDQFSFAVSLFEALYGLLPFADEDDPDFIAKIAEGQVRDPPHGAAVPGRIHRALLRALHAAPAERFASMDQLIAALTDDPARRTRRLGLGAGLVAVSGLVTFGLVEGVREPAAQCTGAADKLATVWGEQRATTVQAAFDATGLPYASHAWGQVNRTLAKYTQAWSEQHVVICEATNVRGEQSAALMDVRMACLDRARAQLSSLAEQLDNADAALVGRAVGAVQSLPDLEACASEQPGRASADLDGATRIKIREASAELAAIQGVIAAGRHTLAQPRNNALIDVARQLPSGELLAQTLTQGARIARAKGQPDRAATMAVEASSQARQADAARAEVAAWAELMFIEGIKRENVSGALAYGVAADASLARVEDADVGTLVYLAKSRGSVLLQAGRYGAAQEALQQAVKTLADSDQDMSVALAETLINLAVALDRDGQKEAAIDRLEEASTIIADLFGPEHPRMGSVAINLGNMLQDSGEREAARIQYERGLSIYRAVFGDQDLRVARAWIGLATLEKADGNLTAARQGARQARSILQQSAEPSRILVATVENLLGRVDRMQARTDPTADRDALLESAIAHHTEALNAYRTVYGGRPHPRIARTRGDLCRAQRVAGRDAAAREHCEAALQHISPDRKAAAGDLRALADLALLTEHGTTRELMLWTVHVWMVATTTPPERVDAALALADMLWARPPSRMTARLVIGAALALPLTTSQALRAQQWLAEHPAPSRG